jgi:hypothetical protein
MGDQSPENQSDQSDKILEIFYQDIGLWITNAEQLLLLGLHKFTLEIKMEN